MKQLLLLAALLANSTAYADSATDYPGGFKQTGIKFSSSAHSQFEFPSMYYCLTILYIKQERLSGLSAEMQAALAKPMKFGASICDQKKLIGLSGPANEDEKLYVDFVTIENALTYLRQATRELPANDDLANGLTMIDHDLLNLRINWITAQTGFDAGSYPNIVDSVKHEWTSAIDQWVRAKYNSF